MRVFIPTHAAFHTSALDTRLGGGGERRSKGHMRLALRESTVSGKL